MIEAHSRLAAMFSFFGHPSPHCVQWLYFSTCWISLLCPAAALRDGSWGDPRPEADASFDETPRGRGGLDAGGRSPNSAVRYDAENFCSQRLWQQVPIKPFRHRSLNGGASSSNVPFDAFDKFNCQISQHSAKIRPETFWHLHLIYRPGPGLLESGIAPNLKCEPRGLCRLRCSGWLWIRRRTWTWSAQVSSLCFKKLHLLETHIFVYFYVCNDFRCQS